MKYFKIVNLLNIFGQADYKGLDIEKFIAGSQMYKSDFSECAIATNEETIPVHPELTEISEADYITYRNLIIQEQQAQKQSTEQQVADLRAQNAQMLLALVQGGLM
jgi:hypothetical protein